ncbi:hypothetical protein BJX64DRAFT_301306 [Aspergillus heterothallicus]
MDGDGDADGHRASKRRKPGHGNNSSTQSRRRKSYLHGDYTVGWVCPLEVELIAALEMLDEEHERLPQPPADHNVYHLGSIAGHNVVIASLAQAGNCVAATVVAQMRLTFPNVRYGLLVGIGGGVPVVTEEGMLRLGDVVVSRPAGLYSGVIQYDRGKAEVGKFVRTGALAPPPPVLLLAAQSLAAKRARSIEDPLLESIRRIDTELPGLRRYRFPGAHNDFLFPASYTHIRKGLSCEECLCSPEQRIHREEHGKSCIAVHRGTIASGELVIKDGSTRDLLGQEYGVLCFEMEAAGTLSDFPCLVIRGISDYCDSHKNDQWHGFAAAAAAASARHLFFHIPIDQTPPDVPKDEPGIRRIVKRSDNQERDQIAAWISPMSYAEIKADHLKRRETGTGVWFLETTGFHSWKANKGVLYCPGIPGAGKTVLSAVVVDYLQASRAADWSIGIAYIFCDYRQQQNQTLNDLLASVLRQLVQTLPIIPDDLQALYQRHRKDGMNLHKGELFSCLQTVCKAYSQVYLIVDALDECSNSDGTRDAVISYLLDLQGSCNLEIAARFEAVPTVEIRAIDADIKGFIQGHVHEVSNCVRRNPQLADLIVTEVVASARGMFLLSKLHLDSLRGKSSPRSIKLALSKLQTGSDAYDYAYQEAMKRIQAQHPDQAHLATRLLSWLTCSLRPLTLTELQHALAVEIGEDSFDDENLPDVGDMVSACAGLVTYHEESHIITLVHYTAQEYFERQQASCFPGAHRDICHVCVTLLSYDAFGSGHCKTDQDFHERGLQYPLYNYAARHWGRHARSHSFDHQLVLKLLRSDKKNFSGRVTGLHLASRYGLDAIIPALLQDDMALENCSPELDTPLSLAVYHGHRATVKLLLHNGASIYDATKGHTSLCYAAGIGRIDLAKILLEAFEQSGYLNGNDRVHSTELTGKSGIPISRAYEGNTTYSSHVDGGLDWLNELRMAFHFAVAYGHQNIVEMLIDYGIDPVNTKFQDRTPLSRAAENGHTHLITFFKVRSIKEPSSCC